MSKYDLTLIFKPSLTEENIDAIIGKLKIKEGKRKNWGKRLFTYPIKKEKEGIYLFLETESDPAKTQDLQKRIEVEEGILRYLLVRG